MNKPRTLDLPSTVLEYISCPDFRAAITSGSPWYPRTSSYSMSSPGTRTEQKLYQRMLRLLTLEHQPNHFLSCITPNWVENCGVHYYQSSENRCEWGVDMNSWIGNFNWCMMMTGPLLAWIQKLTVQHFTLEVENLFNKPKTFTPVCRWLLVMLLLIS